MVDLDSTPGRGRLRMWAVSTALAALMLGLPLGVVHVVCDHGGLAPDSVSACAVCAGMMGNPVETLESVPSFGPQREFADPPVARLDRVEREPQPTRGRSPPAWKHVS